MYFVLLVVSFADSEIIFPRAKATSRLATGLPISLTNAILKFSTKHDTANCSTRHAPFPTSCARVCQRVQWDRTIWSFALRSMARLPSHKLVVILSPVSHWDLYPTVVHWDIVHLDRAIWPFAQRSMARLPSHKLVSWHILSPVATLDYIPSHKLVS